MVGEQTGEPLEVAIARALANADDVVYGEPHPVLVAKRVSDRQLLAYQVGGEQQPVRREYRLASSHLAAEELRILLAQAERKEAMGQ